MNELERIYSELFEVLKGKTAWEIFLFNCSRKRVADIVEEEKPVDYSIFFGTEIA